MIDGKCVVYATVAGGHRAWMEIALALIIQARLDRKKRTEKMPDVDDAKVIGGVAGQRRKQFDNGECDMMFKKVAPIHFHATKLRHLVQGFAKVALTCIALQATAQNFALSNDHSRPWFVAEVGQNPTPKIDPSGGDDPAKKKAPPNSTNSGPSIGRGVTGVEQGALAVQQQYEQQREICMQELKSRFPVPPAAEAELSQLSARHIYFEIAQRQYTGTPSSYDLRQKYFGAAQPQMAKEDMVAALRGNANALRDYAALAADDAKRNSGHPGYYQRMLYISCISLAEAANLERNGRLAASTTARTQPAAPRPVQPTLAPANNDWHTAIEVWAGDIRHQCAAELIAYAKANSPGNPAAGKSLANGHVAIYGDRNTEAEIEEQLAYVEKSLRGPAQSSWDRANDKFNRCIYKKRLSQLRAANATLGPSSGAAPAPRTGSSATAIAVPSPADRSKIIAGDGRSAMDCVKLVTIAKGDSKLGGGGRVLANECRGAVEVTWCYVDKECSTHTGSTWTVQPGKSWPVSADREIRFAACHGADTVLFERGTSGLRYICKAPARTK